MVVDVGAPKHGLHRYGASTGREEAAGYATLQARCPLSPLSSVRSPPPTLCRPGACFNDVWAAAANAIHPGAPWLVIGASPLLRGIFLGGASVQHRVLGPSPSEEGRATQKPLMSPGVGKGPRGPFVVPGRRPGQHHSAAIPGTSAVRGTLRVESRSVVAAAQFACRSHREAHTDTGKSYLTDDVSIVCVHTYVLYVQLAAGPWAARLYVHCHT